MTLACYGMLEIVGTIIIIINWCLTGRPQRVKFNPGLTANWRWCNPFLVKLTLNQDLP